MIEYLSRGFLILLLVSPAMKILSALFLLFLALSGTHSLFLFFFFLPSFSQAFFLFSFNLDHHFSTFFSFFLLFVASTSFSPIHL